MAVAFVRHLLSITQCFLIANIFKESPAVSLLICYGLFLFFLAISLQPDGIFQCDSTMIE